jgi:phosphoglycerate dehydrogenase-like enzyme
MLAGLKRGPHYERRVFAGEFGASMKESFVAGLHQLSSRRVGLIGFGDIAKTLAKLLGAFRM